MKILKIAVLLAAACLATGCISTHSYVDPNFSKADYQDIQAPNEKYQAQVLVEFQRNGEHLSRVDNELRGHVERSLRATGVIVPSEPGSPYTIKVVANNIADMSEAAAKGFGTGLTFGAAGSLVTDYYEFSIEFEDGNSVKKIQHYKHALHTTVGNEKAPFDNVESTTPADGFGQIVEQIILNFVKDMQSGGSLTLHEHYFRSYNAS